MAEVFVPGMPVPQGSVRAFATGAGRAVVVHSASTRVKSWRSDIALTWRAAGHPLITAGPVEVLLDFYFPHPKVHMTTKGLIRATAPVFHSMRPDIDKLGRTVLDALTGTAFHDDSQVARLTMVKSYVESDEVTGVRVEVRAIP